MIYFLTMKKLNSLNVIYTVNC